ncbi:MAG TPA: NADH-quinone oxidoreductase subunit NuoF [Dehalococcoidales bacterium]|nr:NADH-quinone oxidoreductase subunit NuoF [Dehalococcoidales bacterium]
MSTQMLNSSPGGTQTVIVCQGTGCVSSGSVKIFEELVKGIAQEGLAAKIKAKISGCHGCCEQGPIVIVEPEGIFYCKVKLEDVPEIVASQLKNNHPVERLLYKNPLNGEIIPHYRDIPFYAKQQRLVLRNCGHIDPEKIDDYIAVGGYQGLKQVLAKMSPEQVIEEVRRSGLRGRGGAGFPTGQKWEGCRKADGDIKYVICNADEGDPGAFMDRSVLEGDPHSVIEGMVISAYAIGSTEGYVYVRAEYPLAVKRLRLAIKEAEARGFLGKNILGKGFSFQIHVNEGAGAFVCGESTALMRSIEGKPGKPRQTPPRSVEKGLWGKPTSLNNVKTFACVPVIITRGAGWFAGIGTPKSTGTAVFALTGNIMNSGLVEVPMGATLREIIFAVGGGVLGGKPFKAVQIGGPSGGCLPESALDLPVDFDSLDEAGAMMGSGGMVVMDRDTCMVDTARFFLEFTQAESCGKCVPCRIGTKRMFELLTKITEGRGVAEDVEILSELAEGISTTALCGLGQSAPNPILSTIRYFRDEYDEHIKNHRCRAGVCKSMITYFIEPAKCQACGSCRRQCPTDAIEGAKNLIHIIHQEKCVKCGNCVTACPPRFSAIKVISGEPVPAVLPASERTLVRTKGEK